MSNEKIRVFVGTDRSQALAVRILEHSIKRHTTAHVEVIPMQDLPVPKPRDPRNGQRTGFSYSRFCIPALAGFQGKAIYLDADMLVFGDILELWNLPMEGAKVLIQREVKFGDITTAKPGAPRKRSNQSAVMVLDCARLDWSIEKIVADMDNGLYNYEQLMYEMCILDTADIRATVPFEWNSLEHHDSTTRLLHYTDMYTQPWIFTGNKFGHLWFDEIRRMLGNGTLTLADVSTEIEAGFFRPSLLRDIQYRHKLPTALHFALDACNRWTDTAAGFSPHKEVYQAKKEREQVIAQYLERNH
jgi:hypothetical protein